MKVKLLGRLGSFVVGVSIESSSVSIDGMILKMNCFYQKIFCVQIYNNKVAL